MNTLLLALLSDEFRMRVSGASTPYSLRRRLANSDEVTDLRHGIESMAVTERDIREFADHLLASFEPGVRYCDDFAIAAIAVALEDSPSPFAAEYLQDLADLELAELSAASAVARITLERRVGTGSEEATIIISDQSWHLPPSVTILRSNDTSGGYSWDDVCGTVLVGEGAECLV